jgi:fatty-acyl-CoA synthase
VRVTFRQLDDTVNTLVPQLEGLGLSRGDKVAIMLPTCPEILYVAFALAKIEAAPCWATPRGTTGLPKGTMASSFRILYPEANLMVAYTTMMKMILGWPTFDQYDVSSMRRMALGGDPVTADLVRQIQERFGCQTIKGYGMTEANPITTTRLDDPPELQADSDGRPSPGMELRLVDDERREVPFGETGEVAVRGLSVFNRIRRQTMDLRETVDANQTLYESLQSVVQELPDKEAIVLGETRLTYRQLGERVDGLAAGLSQLGVGKGDKVCLMLPTCVENLYAFFALAKLGAPFVPMSPQFRPFEAQHLLGDSEAVALITAAQLRNYDYLAMIEGIRPNLPNLRHVIAMGGTDDGKAVSLDGLLQTQPTATIGAAPEPDDLLALLYTSGTTGFPKGAMHTHRNLALMMDSILSVVEPSVWECMLNPFPMFHFAGVLIGIMPTLVGGKMVLMPAFNPQEALRLIAQERVTMFGGVPTMLLLMLRMPDFDQCDLSSIRMSGSGAAPVPPELVYALKERLGCSVLNGYGLTETGLISMTTEDDPLDAPAHTVGRPGPGVEVKITDDDRNELSVGEVGEIAARSATLLKGYYKRPEETAEAFDEDGWFYTGDIGKIDEDGYVRILDRKGDMLIRGGANVYPAEIENFLVTHPKIQMAAVIGVPSPVSGERVRAYILPMERAKLTETEVMDYCRGQIAGYKLPDEVRFVESFPLSALRKVQKFKLREEARKELEQGA